LPQVGRRTDDLPHRHLYVEDVAQQVREGQRGKSEVAAKVDETRVRLRRAAGHTEPTTRAARVSVSMDRPLRRTFRAECAVRPSGFCGQIGVQLLKWLRRSTP